MFTLVSGTPGAGKTLWTVSHLKDGLKFPDKDEFRPVYYFGIPEVVDDLGWIELDDPKLWHEVVPDGSIVIIDECQEHFPVRPAKNPVPAGLSAIERHRHRGLDLFFITQHPSLLDHHARRLVGQHCHLKRNFGAGFSVLYRSNECMGDIQDYHTLQKAEKTNFKHPKDTFGLYKSAEVHTHKFRIPKMLYVLVALVAFIIGMMFYMKSMFFDEESKIGSDKVFGETAAVDNDSGFDILPAVVGGKGKNKQVSVDSFVPAIDNVPATSPYYSKEWKPKSVPIVSSCLSSSTSCDCYTQQGSLALVTSEYCNNFVKYGASYDHTLKDNRQSNRNNKNETTKKR